MEKEDKIVIVRGIIGICAGIISFFLIQNILASLITPIASYLLSILIVNILFRNVSKSKWDLFGRGVAILFSAWLLIFLALYNV
ncbi:hypothetical protein [Sulfolobus acidocaldarius]|uniref:Uncharacterized protein n=4 Tax=Sulfolobus acidocaldarius TaxID=2285 RepID=Q4JAL5_SULAC|nr:hypothetical protein [Sulfolobus acidocaldarius]AHC51146.1 hypothetical protein SUSAZ_03585 [Sulfolobus acidocaldarius SUSAZ]AAY80164.1 hypothetical protein Saci_0794 [Sulfolobus acidocaldarius DSM 639]AGE70742.1 hypothetical protein SacN8_03850 [Sulfolobus acidocaldarius N8]AGE73014.1 hypothetical protein SacRon12I_03835 [Sulfolobus acidocaldarius Ron12/I]ALU28925.1 hypothetical protein ATY89_02435 [Sulfolobus acidocaldarius]